MGAPGAGVNAGALLGSNVGDAGAGRIEQGVLVVGSGPTGAGVKAGALLVMMGVLVTIGATELMGSIVAPGDTIAKLGRAESSRTGARGRTRADTALARSDRMNVECNMLRIDLIYR